MEEKKNCWSKIRKMLRFIMLSIAVVLNFVGCGLVGCGSLSLGSLGAVAMLMFVSCGHENSLEKVHAVFDSQEAVIRERIADTGADNKDQWKDLTGVIEVDKESGGVIRFMCIAEGIVSSSFEAGFYYSPDDKPTCVGWLSGPLSKDGKGYSYSDGTDNRYYTEKMSENFYYYQVQN